MLGFDRDVMFVRQTIGINEKVKKVPIYDDEG
jgi:hypothetical protein